MKSDLEMMRPVIYKENKTFILTPESKLERWIEIIHQKAIDGYKIKLYSDIESTGFAYWYRGRAAFDEKMDEKMLRKDSEKYFLEIEAIKNNDFPIKITHPMCKTSNFTMKNPSYFSLVVLGKKIFGNENWNEIQEIINNVNITESDYRDLVEIKYKNISKELMINAKSEIKSLISKGYKELTKEAKLLSEGVDRMIEYAFVTCYENKDGEVFLLKDDDGELIYFHEFIYPNNDKKIKEKQVIKNMPLIPYIIHKTDFDFLRGNFVHPFLNITLPKEAPSAEPILKFLLDIFEYKGNKENKKIISENIMMFFHNGNGFDVPFIDAEISKFFEDKKLRDYVQTYDTLKIAKAMIPSDVQKFIASCQYNKNFGGDEAIKLIESEAILPTSKTLDNVRRLASFLVKFDPMKPKKIYEKSQLKFFNLFKEYFEDNNVDWKKFENMLEYSLNSNPDIILTKGFPTGKKQSDILSNYKSRYDKYLEGRKEYIQSLNKVKKFDNIYKNINNIKENIEKNPFLKDALFRLNNIDRSVHGARVDSQLFMDAFIVLENALYLKPKKALKSREIDIKDLTIQEDKIKKLIALKKGNK